MECYVKDCRAYEELCDTCLRMSNHWWWHCDRCDCSWCPDHNTNEYLCNCEDDQNAQ